VLEIIQGKTTVAGASRAYDLSPSEVEGWMDESKRGTENALRSKPEDMREQYERQLQELQQAYGEAMLELRARKKLQTLLDEEGNDPSRTGGMLGYRVTSSLSQRCRWFEVLRRTVYYRSVKCEPKLAA